MRVKNKQNLQKKKKHTQEQQHYTKTKMRKFYQKSLRKYAGTLRESNESIHLNSYSIVYTVTRERDIKYIV